jgi:large subunit ribosomal protein L13
MKIYDLSDQILGRISTRIAKDLLKTENVVIVNCEKAILSGGKKDKFKLYSQRVVRGDPHHGPFYPRTPDGIVRRTVRGMLPFYKVKGQEALRRLKVYIGIPDEFKNKQFIRVEEFDVNKLKCKYMTIGDLSVALGAKKRW